MIQIKRILPLMPEPPKRIPVKVKDSLGRKVDIYIPLTEWREQVYKEMQKQIEETCFIGFDMATGNSETATAFIKNGEFLRAPA
jgi:hypothetical protein